MSESGQRIGDPSALKAAIRDWGAELGFQQIGVSDVDLERAESRLQEWLQDGCHGEMNYMARHGSKRSRPQELVPGTVRVITARMDYLPEEPGVASDVLARSLPKAQ